MSMPTAAMAFEFVINFKILGALGIRTLQKVSITLGSAQTLSRASFTVLKYSLSQPVHPIRKKWRHVVLLSQC